MINNKDRKCKIRILILFKSEIGALKINVFLRILSTRIFITLYF